MENLVSGQCAGLSSPSYVNFGLSIFILLGILVSYLPQHYRIVARRSSEGISPYFVLLGTTSGTCAFANILTVPASRRDLACCKELNAFDCTAGLLGIAQVGVQWACFTVILLLFLLFFPSAPALLAPAKPKNQPTYRTAITVSVICVVHVILVCIISMVMIYRFPTHLRVWAYFLGVLGTILAAIQFLPQIWTTWQLQAVGSLSIPMMCIQTPGSFVWVGSLSARFGWEGWSTWGIYLVTGVLQGCLLVMGIIFEVRERRKRRNHEYGTHGEINGQLAGDVGSGDHERTSLLDNER